MPADHINGTSKTTLQRPRYIPPSASGDVSLHHLGTPSRPRQSSFGAHAVGSAASPIPEAPSPARMQSNHSMSSPSNPRRPRVSASAYQRFDEVAWIVDLSSRIGDALQSPSHPSAQVPAAASPSSSSLHNLPRSRSRVRLPRPSKEFRDLQQRIQLNRVPSPASAALDADSTHDSSFASDDSLSATQWAANAQSDFERRRTELERSRRAVLERMASSQDAEADSQSEEADALAASDPAVQRSLLAAKSLQELMRGGGLQPEDPQVEHAGLADILSSAEPLSSSELDLGPSALFEANRGADGALDIESILQQRARIAALEDQRQPHPSSSDVAPKKPVIEVLQADTALPGSSVSQRALVESDESSSGSSDDSVSSSDASSSESGSDADAADTDNASAASNQIQQASQTSSAPQPMDQIAIVNGTFTIVPDQSAQTPAAFDLAATRDDVEDSAQYTFEEDANLDEEFESEASDADAASDELDDDEDMVDEDPSTLRDRYANASPHDSVFDGPAGDADEPIVLSDSDEGSQSSDEGDSDDDEQVDDQETVEAQDYSLGSQDQLLDEAPSEHSDDSDAGSDSGSHVLVHDDEIDGESSTHHHSQLLDSSQDAHQGAQVQNHAEPELETLSAEVIQPDDHIAADITMHDRASPTDGDGRLFDTYLAEPDSDAMPESEVEPEEVDEDLRWSDLDNQQSSHEDISSPHPPQFSSVSSAFRALQGAQALPGFVTASQLQASIETIESQAQDAVEQASPAAIHAVEQIDPLLMEALASVPNDERQDQPASKQEDSDGADGAVAAHDAESSDTSPKLDVPSVPVDVDTVEVDGAISANPPSASHGTTDQVVVQDKSQQLMHDDEGRQDLTDEKEEDTAADANRSVASRSDLIEVAQDGADDIRPAPLVLAEADDEKSSPAAEAREDPIAVEEADTIVSATTAPVSAPAEASIGSASEPAKPTLVRIESTDVLEADVEDNSEEEVVEQPILIEPAKVSAPSPLLTPALDTGVKSDSGEALGSAIMPDEDVAIDGSGKTDVPFSQDDVNQPAIRVATDDEGILSGDLADRDTSVERQTAPLGADSADQTMDDALADEKRTDDELGASSSVPAKRKARAESDTAEQHPDAEQSSLPNLDGDDSERVETAPHKKAKLETDAGDVSNELPAVSGSGEAQKPSNLSPLVMPKIPATSRVPPSPASSDRRSVSSFTPSANRHGHRHLHGAAKRNLLSQMTEAASTLASNLAAPLRALPSLLPIRESPAAEGQQVQGTDEAIDVGADQGEHKSSIPDEDPASSPIARSEPAKFTITTRSHCLYRRLQLSGVTGSPVFLVPGCSINHEDARDEHAQDLGEASEQNSDDWVDVDPDFLPLEVHHMLSRIVGLQILREGIFAEPNSAAAELVAASYDFDMDLQQTADDEQGSPKAFAVDQDNPMEATPIDDLPHPVPGTPPRASQHIKVSESTRKAATASPQRRSPRRSDPSNADANYLPEDERKSLQRERHSTAAAPGDVSIASLEEHVDEEARDSGDPDDLHLHQGDDDAGGNGEATDSTSGTAPVPIASQAKKRRGRPRKSAAAATDTGNTAPEADKVLIPKALARGRGGRQRTESGDHRNAGNADDAGDESREPGVNQEAAETIAASRPRRSGRVRQDQEEAELLDPQDKKPDQVEVESDKLEAQRDETPPQAEADSEKPLTPARKRKRVPKASSSQVSAAEADKSEEKDQVADAKQPRRSRRSQGGNRAPSTSPTKTTPRKSPKRKVLKLN
ncbi:uncharacterized protein PAN0_001c0138 [Moesziomyces antarcticus]|uniref:Uncharacterized protein n=1 Tax=Pseudozyma antarctica TaxID=84753 RepID=A0A5C3FDF4_PSEA2|nr:uncharacterized protein PAN0_001c0138 [Moesziomyces antarcticus]GAK61943.1 hypothetical protein PAN0_001c0138 [Moesziomyces antarcticus]SPO42463.1 uncharacterized protein PSANT_00146 [Moesziomyces antarcticus]